MTEYIKNQSIRLCDNPEWSNDMLNTWDFKPERESQAIKESISMYGHYIVGKCFDISSEEEYMNQYPNTN